MVNKLIGLILAWLLWAVPAQAAFTCDVTATGTNAPADHTTATTAAFNSTGKDLLIVMVAVSLVETNPAVTDNQGNMYTDVTTGASSQFNKLRMVYTRPSTTSMTHTVKYDNAANSYPTIGVLACGGSVANPIDLFASVAKNAGTTISTSITPQANDEVVVTAIAQYIGGAMTVDGGFSTPVTVNYVDSGGQINWGLAFSYLIQTTATVAAPTWTTPNNDTSMVIAAFKNAGGIAPCTTP